MNTIVFPISKKQVPACVPTEGANGHVVRAAFNPEDQSVALVLDMAAARLELLAHEAEADARQFNTLREPSAAAAARLEADALRLAADYLRDERAGLPDWLEGIVDSGEFITFRPSRGVSRTVTSFRPACEVLLEHACQLGTQADDNARSDKVISAGFRTESTALRFAAAVLSQEQPATAADLAA